MMYTGTDYTSPGGLVDFVADENIPDFLGGKKPCGIPEGEPVPKSLYKAEWEKGDGVKLWEDTIYKSANVQKGVPHEVRTNAYIPQKNTSRSQSESFEAFSINKYGLLKQ